MEDRGDQSVADRRVGQPSTSRRTAPVMLNFQAEILENALDSDAGGMYVLAPGLGTIQLVAAMLKIQDEKRKFGGGTGVTLVIGADHSQREALVGELARIHPREDWFGYEDTDKDNQDAERGEPRTATGSAAGTAGRATATVQNPRHVTADLPSAERLRLYDSSSYLCVTTRILVVDLLSGRLDPGRVSGIIVLNAHNVSESSGEGFVVKLYRTKGGTGFVWAFSEHPIALTSEFAKAEKVLKALYCNNFQLWPRFRTAVQDEFEMAAPELVEVSVCADPEANIIYEAIAELLDASVKELKKLEKLDTADLTPSQGLTSAFDETIRLQLASVWHTVPPKVRQLVDDMRTLRSLATYLLKFDAVTFFRYLENLRTTDGTKSAWMFHSASHIIFEAAKKRVYRSETNAKGNTITPVLEELPKWKPLLEIIEEIMDENQGDENDARPIVVFCEDEYTCEQLQKIARPEGAKAYMESVYLQYLASKSGPNKKSGNKKRKASRRPADVSLANQLEEKALRKEAKELTALQSVAGGWSDRAKGEDIGNGKGAAGPPESASDTPNVRLGSIAEWFEKNLVFLPSNASGYLTLWTHEPNRIIVYDPDVALVRQIELYTAQQQAKRIDDGGDTPVFDLVQEAGEAREVHAKAAPNPTTAFTEPKQISDNNTIRVYLLRYEPSPELDKFHARLARERKSFEDLIRSKGAMALNLSNDDKHITFNPIQRADNAASANSITRKGGGGPATMDKIRLVVDMREFMSSLPAVLYAQAYNLVPVTLEVGDYILSPEICVERKTIPDLRGSLQSGRLYQQAEAMCKHYPISILLIEFDGDRAFALQSAAELGTEIQSSHIMSRLVLLCLHHPRLRLVWSRSLHATADMFRQLKANYDEPDPAVCAQVGVDPTNANSNTAALDMLRRLPGVNDSNFRALCKEAGSISGLCKLSSETLQGIMGSGGGQRLYEFLRRRPGPDEFA